jgi:hypothetical protein
MGIISHKLNHHRFVPNVFFRIGPGRRPDVHYKQATRCEVQNATAVLHCLYLALEIEELQTLDFWPRATVTSVSHNAQDLLACQTALLLTICLTRQHYLDTVSYLRDRMPSLICRIAYYRRRA